MKEKLPDNCKLAHFTNDFARNAEIGFTKARQLLLFLALVSQTNPFDDKEEMTGVLNVCEIERLIKRDGTAKSGSLYDEVKRFVQNMLTRNYVQFTPNVDDKAAQSILKDYNVIFDRLRVVKKGGGTYYQYRFHEDMRPHIKMLKQNFVSLSIPKNVKSGHAIRFLMLSKAHHDRVRAYKQVSQLKLPIEELNRILGIQGKYKRFNNLKIRVIEPIIREVNASGLLNIVSHKYLKTGYSFSHIEFSLKDGDLLGNRQTAKAVPTNSVSNATVKLKLPKGKKDFIPTLDDENQLKQAQYIAYHFLVQRGCVRGIAYRHIVQKMPSSECLGWEDLYIYNAWKYSTR